MDIEVCCRYRESYVDNTFGVNRLPQVWTDGNWRDLTDAQIQMDLYPMMLLAPDGRVFNPGPQQRARYIDLLGRGDRRIAATDPPHLAGLVHAYAINERGDIVGSSEGSNRSARAVIIMDGVMRDLNGLISAGSGWVLTEARDINDSGRIVGTGWRNGEQRGFLLTPS